MLKWVYEKEKCNNWSVGNNGSQRFWWGTNNMATKVEMKEVNKRLDKVDNRLGRIEDVLLEKHDEEIKSLKARVRILENALGIE